MKGVKESLPLKIVLLFLYPAEDKKKWINDVLEDMGGSVSLNNLCC